MEYPEDYIKNISKDKNLEERIEDLNNDINILEYVLRHINCINQKIKDSGYAMLISNCLCIEESAELLLQ